MPAPSSLFTNRDPRNRRPAGSIRPSPNECRQRPAVGHGHEGGPDCGGRPDRRPARRRTPALNNPSVDGDVAGGVDVHSHGRPDRQRRRSSSCANSAGPVPAATTTTGPRVRRPGPPRYRGWRGAGSARRSGSRSRPRPWLPTNLELTDLERTDFHLAGAQSAHHRISNREAADRERPHCRGSQRQRRHDRRCDGSRSDDLRADEAAADGGRVGPVPKALRPIHDGSLSSISVSFRAGCDVGRLPCFEALPPS
jgi:hypothetical protein